MDARTWLQLELKIGELYIAQGQSQKARDLSARVAHEAQDAACAELAARAQAISTEADILEGKIDEGWSLF